MKFLTNFVEFVNLIGLKKINSLCDWGLYQEKEPVNLKKYRKF